MVKNQQSFAWNSYAKTISDSCNWLY